MSDNQNEKLKVTQELKKYFETLGLDRNIDDEVEWKDIKNAYHALARKVHPDRTPNKTNDFIQVKEAYEKLKDAKDKLTEQALAGDESKITAKVGGEKEPKPNIDNKTRLESELERLNEKLDRLKKKPDDPPRSPEDAYKLLYASADIAEIIAVKYQIAKVKYFHERSQDENLTPEQRAKLEKDVDNYFSRNDTKEKYGAIGSKLGSYLGPLGGIIGKNLGEFLSAPASLISKAMDKMSELKNNISNTFSQSGASGILEEDANDTPNPNRNPNEVTLPEGPKALTDGENTRPHNPNPRS